MIELESHRVFAGVGQQTLAAYRSVFSIQHVRRSSVIFDQDDDASSVFLVLRGRIALHRVAPCGREIAPALLGPGSIVGADALSEFGGRRSARAVAITDSTGLLVTASDLMRILAHDGTVASNIVRILCSQQEAVVAALEELATLNVVDRIARFLARLAAPSDGQWTDTVRVGLPLTHEQIAAFVSSSRETVSLEMGRLVRSGRVIRDQNGYALRREP
jgi:CRP/FNR family transcriptional regulator